jgi:chromate reductase
MTTIIGICGSLRRGSFNAMLLRAAAEVAPLGTAIEQQSIREVPLYDGDLEEEHGVPAVVERLKTRIASADGLLMVTPEYNHSLPGVLKNAMDWLSRPAEDIPRVFGGRPVAIIGATPGPGGTALAQAAWLPVVRTVFDPNGRIADAATRQRVQRFIEGFAEFAATQRLADLTSARP